MGNQTALSLYQKIERFINDGNLFNAFCEIKANRGLLSKHLNTKLNHLEEAYKYMLHYFADGYEDISREKLIANTLSGLYFLNDAIYRESIIKDSSDIYSSTVRYERIRNSSLNEKIGDLDSSILQLGLANDDNHLEQRKIFDESLKSLFNYIWTMFGSPESEYQHIINLYRREDLPYEAKSQIISALLLGNLFYFDPIGYQTLLNLHEINNDLKLDARISIALILLLLIISDKINKELVDHAHLNKFLTDSALKGHLDTLVSCIVKTKDTKRVTSKMQNEVIPEIMKIRPEIIDKLKNLYRDSEVEMFESNPEWEEIIEKTGIADKFQELTDMQLEGGDVMMLAFSNLKNFPFFNEVANWFLPFSSENFYLKSSSKEMAEVIDKILGVGGMMCDSDKYSFAFSLAYMPKEQRDMMASRMEEQISQLKDAMTNEIENKEKAIFDHEAICYIRDLYRFYKIFRKRKDLTDPFEKDINLFATNYFSECLDSLRLKEIIADFYFKYGYYREALPLLDYLDRKNPGNPQIWEKIGFCHNSLNNLKEALTWYKKAELLNPESIWLIKRIATCNRLLNNYQGASEYYLKSLEFEPENYNLLVNAGNSFLESGHYNDALKCYYHAEYLKPKNLAVKRAIAWTELLNGNLDKSLSVYDDILHIENLEPMDYLNRGHIHMLKGFIRKAIDDYSIFLKINKNDFSILGKAIKDDFKYLKSLGLKKEQLDLVIEKMRYDVLD